MEIDKRFFNANSPKYPVTVMNVGELKEQLNNLPDELPLADDGYELHVFNNNSETAELELLDAEPEAGGFW